MTYSNEIITASIKLYSILKKDGYVGKELQNIISNTFNISISTFYNWLSKYNNEDEIKEHDQRISKITPEIEKFVVDTVKEKKNFKMKKLKKDIHTSFNVHLSKISIYSQLN